jgi:hypothetical protein
VSDSTRRDRVAILKIDDNSQRFVPAPKYSAIPKLGRPITPSLVRKQENYRDAAIVHFALPAQPVDATQVLNPSAGVSNCKVSRGRSLS